MKLLQFIVAGLLALFMSFGARAQAVDYTSLTSAVSFTGVVTALLAVGAIFVGVLVARKGIKWILAMLGR